MASVDGGATARSGPVTPLLTPAGSSGLTSGAAQNEAATLASSVLDAGDYGPTAQPANFGGSGVAQIVGVQIHWFNQGYYAATKSFESWISINAPSAIAPSGHTLLDVQSFVVS